MSENYLADVQMPTRAEPEELHADVDVSEIDEEMHDDDGVEEDTEPLPPPPLKKEKLKTEDIFKPKRAPPKNANPVITPLSQDLHDEPIVPKLKPEKKKRQMSEKQLEALARGRAKRAEKIEPKTPRPKPEPTRPEPAPAPAPSYPMYSQKDVEELIFQGVSRYDSLRKKRKEEKRASQAKQIHEQKVFSTINSAMNHHNDPWSAAFSF